MSESVKKQILALAAEINPTDPDQALRDILYPNPQESDETVHGLERVALAKCHQSLRNSEVFDGTVIREPLGWAAIFSAFESAVASAREVLKGTWSTQHEWILATAISSIDEEQIDDDVEPYCRGAAVFLAFALWYKIHTVNEDAESIGELDYFPHKESKP